MKFNELIGKTFTDIQDMSSGETLVVFTDTEGRRYKLYHEQDCCEAVWLEDVCGDIADILHSPIVNAEEVSCDPEDNTSMANKYRFLDTLANRDTRCIEDSQTWTFYKLDTVKGGVTLRWIGESSGYYSESVYFEEIL